MSERTYVIGVGMTKFEKPGARDWDYPDMGREAGERALADARIGYAEVQVAFLSYCNGDSTSGQRALYELGMSGIPAINVNNNCSSGSSALYLARRFVQGGFTDCALALGFEKMEKGSLGAKFTDRTMPLDKHFRDMKRRRGILREIPGNPQLFGNAGREYMERYGGVTAETFARISEKNHRHSVNNPYSQFQDAYSLQDVLASPMVYDPLTKLQCCPTSDGGAAAIVASERFVAEHNLHDHAVEIVGQAMASDFESTFSGSDISLVGGDMTRAAARAVYAESGFGPEDVDVIELHDCFSSNELITYDALGLCEAGGAGELVHSGATTYGGEWV
ncbi:thiolase C-terminal domain-containing protein, partial [Mycolicibacterium sp.]